MRINSFKVCLSFHENRPTQETKKSTKRGKRQLNNNCYLKLLDFKYPTILFSNFEPSQMNVLLVIPLNTGCGPHSNCPRPMSNEWSLSRTILFWVLGDLISISDVLHGTNEGISVQTENVMIGMGDRLYLICLLGGSRDWHLLLFVLLHWPSVCL